MSGKAVGAPSAGQVEIEAYDYLGLSTVVRVLRAEQAGAGGSLTYVAVGSEGTNTWAGDAYNGLDRFGRVADRRWVLGSTAAGADADRLKYGYDAGSNPLYKLNTLSSAHSEVFTYDGLGRLATFDRGSIAFSGSGVATIASPTRSQDWTLDTLGNWDSLTTDGGTPVSRTHDRQNRLTSLAGQSLTYDANGNQLTDEAGNVLVYDAWDRNVGWYNPDTSGYVDPGYYVSDDDGNPTVSNPYDALGRRVSRRWTTDDISSLTTQTDTAYLSAPDGRRLWERTLATAGSIAEGDTDAGFDVAGYTYVYAATDPNRLAARDTFSRTTVGDPRFNAYNGPTFLAERAYVRGDLVGNTTSTAVITSDGTNASVGSTERYALDPYGDGVVVMDGGFAPKSGNDSDRGWAVFFQGGFTDPASGLIHFGAREYDPSLGRWLQQDPSGWPDGANRYEAMGSAPTLFTDPTGLAKVVVWDPGNMAKGEWGHAALILDDGTYISWWPDGTRVTSAKGPFIEAPSREPSYEHDSEGGSKPPDRVIQIDGLDEAAIKDWWERFRKRHVWKTVSMNCSTVVYKALRKGGAHMALWRLIWTPDDVTGYAQDVRDRLAKGK